MALLSLYPRKLDAPVVGLAVYGMNGELLFHFHKEAKNGPSRIRQNFPPRLQRACRCSPAFEIAKSWLSQARNKRFSGTGINATSHQRIHAKAKLLIALILDHAT